jgi:hypothetical protein
MELSVPSGVQPSQREHFVSQGLGLGFAYESGAVIPDEAAEPAPENSVERYVPSAAPGRRAPHVWLDASGERRSTLDLFEDVFVLLAGDDGHAWVTAAEKLGAESDVPLRAYSVGGAGASLREAEPGAFAASYRIVPGGAVLVRPDGHVAWCARNESFNSDPAEELARVLGRLTARGGD